jgi:CheY-like chemotaxis protein
VVDDEPEARELMERLLVDCEAAVTTGASPAEALAHLRAERYDVLISDIGMPGADGYDLIRQVRALPAEAGGRIPALALTAFARAEDRTRAVLAGYQVHLAKPVEPAELVALVGSLAGRSAEHEETRGA